MHAFPAIYATGVAGNLNLEAESLSFFQSELSFFLLDLSFHIAPSFSYKGRVFSGAFTLAVYAGFFFERLGSNSIPVLGLTQGQKFSNSVDNSLTQNTGAEKR